MIGDVESSRYVNRLILDNKMAEVRHINGQITSRWFDEPDRLIEYVADRRLDGNWYTTINRPHDGVDGPARNRDIRVVTRIFLDLDPARPTGTSATDTELDLALIRANDVATHLDAHGWPAPARGISGNGAHLHYRTALLSSDELREQMKSIYSGLDKRFSDESVKLDVAVRNPGRICALYGTIKRKGASTDERPHREATIRIPTRWDQVRPWQVKKLASLYETRETQKLSAVWPKDGEAIKRGDWRTLDIAALFAAHGRYIRPIGDGKHFVKCPWEDEHTTAPPKNGGDTVIFDASVSTTGYPGFYCAHAHCEGRFLLHVAQLWDDVVRYCAK